MKRRDFIKASSALMASRALTPLMLNAAPPCTNNHFKQIAVMNTFIDWYFSWSPSKVGQEPLPFSVEAVKAILDRHAAAGNKTVYWRTTDGGDAMYWSKLCRVSHGPTSESTRKHYGPAMTEKFKEYDFKKFDVFRTAVDYAHKLGMRVLAWFECDNEDHGLGLSEFSLKNPQMSKVYRNKASSPYGLSWAYPEVVQYKVGMAKEMLDYGCDGLFLDLLRGNQSRCIDADGVALWGYSEPSVAAYREKTGQDAFAIPNNSDSWIKHRAGYVTDMLRSIRSMINKHHRKKELAVYINGKDSYVSFAASDNKNIVKGTRLSDPYRGMLLDVATWAQEGLIDALCASRWPRPSVHPPTEEDIRLQTSFFLPMLANHCRYYAEIYGFGGTGEQIVEAVQAAKRLGCDGVVVSEDGCFELGRSWDALKEANNLLTQWNRKG